MCQIDIFDLHTTPLGVERIRRNLELSPTTDVVDYCREIIQDKMSTCERRGKNWYVVSGCIAITVNASSHTIITAHKV